MVKAQLPISPVSVPGQILHATHEERKERNPADTQYSGQCHRNLRDRALTRGAPGSIWFWSEVPGAGRWMLDAGRWTGQREVLRKAPGQVLYVLQHGRRIGMGPLPLTGGPVITQDPCSVVLRQKGIREVPSTTPYTRARDPECAEPHPLAPTHHAVTPCKLYAPRTH